MTLASVPITETIVFTSLSLTPGTRLGSYEIAAAIADALKVTLASGRGALRKHQPSMPAYEAFLRYRHHQWSFTPTSLQKSRECLEEAIRLDPDFALAYVGLADNMLRKTMRLPDAHV